MLWEKKAYAPYQIESLQEACVTSDEPLSQSTSLTDRQRVNVDDL